MSLKPTKDLDETLHMILDKISQLSNTTQHYPRTS